MPTVQQLVREASKLKVKEVPGHVQKFAGQHWRPEQLRSRFMNWLHDYKIKFIDTGSPKPLLDVITYGFVFSYALSWPREYAHYKHEQEAKLKGGHH
ncbi:hypothetical protein COHA_006141 [Chlorella ohadii]|uniref:Uncharacterized protein n=1 Tax=Chlorella ohadii TaxID=2649997 RepID=A0AAD5DLM8_9CHLO|nr:hypothetical protein COHA_006141 [Chlorella ohadii]